MGTQVQYKSYLAGYNPMRDLNDDSNSNSWPGFFGDKNLTNGQYYTGFTPRELADAYPGYDKDALKQKMLEHEATFKTQVHELHRLYRTQKDMMQDIKRNEVHGHRASIEPSSSSSIRESQAPSEDARQWHVPSYPLVDTGFVRSTVSGADLVNSPLSCTKGKNKLASEVPYQNGCTSVDVEVLESRPSKVRKTLFDLQLPAEEYIDVDDAEQHETKTSSICSFTPNREYQIASESSMKPSLGGVTTRKIGGQQESFMQLADLNDPLEVEEATAPSSFKIFGHATCNGGIERVDLCSKPTPGFSGLQNGVLQKSLHGGHTSSMNISSTENKVKEREWLPFMHNSGHGRNNFSSISGGIQLDKLSLPSIHGHVTHNQAHPSLMYLTDHSKGDLWQERAGRETEIADRTRCTTNSHLDTVSASQAPNSYPFSGSSDVAGTWSQFVSSWGKPADSLTQKFASFQTQPSLISSTSLNKSLHPSVQNHDIFRDRRHASGCSSLNQRLGGDRSSLNGFYHGSSSGPKDLPVCFSSAGFDYLNGSGRDNIASERLINHGSEMSRKGSSYMNMNPTKELNLNEAFPKDSLNGTVRQYDLEIIGGKSEPEKSRAVLPWLRANPACKGESSNSRRDANTVASSCVQAFSTSLFGTKIETAGQIFNGTSSSTNHQITPKKETIETQGGQKIFGFAICDGFTALENKTPSLVSSVPSLHPIAEGENAKHGGKTRLIDINVACDVSLLESDDEIAVEEMVVEKGLNQNAFCGRNFIDLNSCISEDEEDPPVPSVARNTANGKVVFEIDLEASPAPESDEDIVPEKEYVQETVLPSPDHKTEQAEDESLKSAAEAIVDISSLCEHIYQESDTTPPSDASLDKSLLWLADAVTCSEDKFENRPGKVGSSFKEIDDFEAAALQLETTKEEDYMPKPFIPEFQYIEETENNLQPARTRRGQARRGRQRRDFQRDILPGLASLSRHEVTEDLQTFGGLMRATGHPWNSGLTKRNGARNGGTRGRRRAVVDTTPPAPAPAPTPAPTPTPAPAPAPAPACSTPLVQQLNNIETGLNDKSLTGWGKTTRRPRRQRCPAGIPPTVPTT